MRGVVYVDVLFFTNALIGLCLLRCCASLTGCAVQKFFLFAGGILAGISSLMVILPPLPAWIMGLMKIISAGAIVALAFLKNGRRIFLKCLLWYVALNVLLSGTILLALYYFEPSKIQIYNMTLYFDVSPLLLICCVTGTYFVMQIMTFLMGRPREQIVLPFRATFGSEKLDGYALWDTGYHVKDPISGASTFLLSFPEVQSKLSVPLEKALSNYFRTGNLQAGDGIRLIPARTATGMRLLPAIKAPLQLMQRERWRETTAALAVFTPERLGDGTFEALVNPATAEH